MPVTMPSSGSGSIEWWQSQLGQAKEARDKLKSDRRDLVNRYRDNVTSLDEDAVRVPIEFEKTEQKRHQLFYRLPTLRIKPHPRTMRESQEQGRDLDQAVRIFREVLQRLAGPRGMNTKKLMDKLLFDAIVIGMGAAIVGYEQFERGTASVADGTMRDMTDDELKESEIDTTQVDVFPQIPNMVNVPNIVYWRIFGSRISPGHLLVPADFIGNDYSNECDWLAHQFRIPVHSAKQKKWRLPKDPTLAAANDDDLMVDMNLPHEAEKQQLLATEVWCYPQRIYSNVPHPLQIRRMVFIEGMDEPVIVQDGRHQVFDENGKFKRGISSLPIKVLTLRYVADHWAPPSDCWMSRRQSKELSEARSQMVKHRQKAVPMRWINTQAILDPRIRALIIAGKYYDTIPVDGPGQDHMGEVAQAQFPRENFTFNDYVMGDIDRIWGLGANQQGVTESTTRTATELSLIQQATENRLTGEKGAVIDFWLDLMLTASKYLQLYADEEDYVEVVGASGAQELAAWTKEDIQGEFLGTIVPDSADRPDAAHERDKALNTHNLLGNSPSVNQTEMARRTLMAMGEEDVDRLVQEPQPPPPEEVRTSLALKGEDLIPASPSHAGAVAALRAKGLEIVAPEAPEASEQPPEGTVDDGQPITAANAIDRGTLQLDEAGSVDNRGGGLTDAGS